MTSNLRSKRRQFPGAFPPDEDLIDLPLEPYPVKAPNQTANVSLPDAPIVLVPIQAMDLSLLDRIRQPIEELYRRPTMIASPLPAPKYAYNPSREQYHSSSILKRVQAARLPDWDCAVGIGNIDLFEPETPFLFGEADRSKRSAIISLRRLWPDIGVVDHRRELLQKRLLSEAIHQIGLIRGLAHCPNNRCVMYPSATILETDKKGLSMCANCRKRLVDLN